MVLHKSHFIHILTTQVKQGMRLGKITYTTDYENDIPEKQEWYNQEGGRGDREKKERERTLKPSVM
jgi:hypothetical protein